MSFFWSDNVHTTAFTPRDYQVELLSSAIERNTLICLGQKSSKNFIALKLIQELSYSVRNNQKKTIYLTNGDGDSPYILLFHLTDLKVLHAVKSLKEDQEVNFEEYQVIIISPVDFLLYLETEELSLESINLIVIEDCHNIEEQEPVFELFRKFYPICEKKPRVLALGGPIHSANCPPKNLKAVLEILENSIHCFTETSSDVVTVLKFCSRPTEFILQCAPPQRTELIAILENLVASRKEFLKDHRYDPSEIYQGDEFLEEIKSIPDPTKEPLEFLDNYISTLHEMGPWCADRAAFMMLNQIEKRKIKTPYERHFLLYETVKTCLVLTRCHCESSFSNCSEMEKIEKFSTPKVLRLIETLRLFKPEKKDSDNVNKLTKELEKLKFSELQFNLEKITQNVEGTGENESKSICKDILENLESILIKREDIPQKTPSDNGSSNQKGRMNKHKRKPYQTRRQYRDGNDSPSICGIIFCNEKTTAKVLFDLLCELSKHDKNLSFIRVQYTVDRVADPVTEPKEAEQEHRRQEDVLKRFRMHDCNLLIGTSVLEEGIDLPKCNLVVRWDTPKSYRSYVQCKGRARAPQAYHVILVAPEIVALSSTAKDISNHCHQINCLPVRPDEVPKPEIEKPEVMFDVNEIPRLLKLQKELNLETTIILNSEPVNVMPFEEAIEKKGFSEEELSKIMSEVLTGTHDGSILKDTEPEELDDSENNQLVPYLSYGGHQNDKRPEFCSLLSKSTIDFSVTEKTEKEARTAQMVDKLAEYREIEKMLLSKCANNEPTLEEHLQADKFNCCLEPFKPLPDKLTGASVDLSGSIALVNKYCAKLPSDTFTKLTPLWRCAKTYRNGHHLYSYTIRLPINSPLKYDIIGIPMPSKVLARRVAALQVCKELHKISELDDNLQPIGKENFKALEPDWEVFELDKIDEEIVSENLEPRPGTTKRRQYYYKRIASEFSNCRPVPGVPAFLYFIKLTLECPIPEEQNTRGRKIYPPEEAVQGFGILTLNKIPKVSSFPIFTRSGEVKVALELSKQKITLTEDQVSKINLFLNYTFTNVLRLQKFLMLFDAEATENSIFIVPTVKTPKTEHKVSIDWNFLELINENCDKMPEPIDDETRLKDEFDPNKFKDAVVMPWYRNQDQPQYFYVAEICNHLSPESSFPGSNYKTFKEYYFRKYGITIQNSNQPLLDVDHTSARLNFLTPRYVNRKGVALPTSSEETKRAKRENLEQKQILVPELCTIHPFPASLWRAAVCLPCILYRINGLLLADEIRKKVSFEMALGRVDITERDDFEWPLLDFGWSLADVLKKCQEAVLKQEKVNEKVEKVEEVVVEEIKIEEITEVEPVEKTANDILAEAEKKAKSDSFVEIGTWSNDMALHVMDEDEDEFGALPSNVNICSSNFTKIRYGSPTSWDGGRTVSKPSANYTNTNFCCDSDNSFQSDDDFDNFDIAGQNTEDDNMDGNLRIEFKPNNVAEAIETEEEILKREKRLMIIQDSIANEKLYQTTKNLEFGYNFLDKPDLNCDLKDLLFKSEIEFSESTGKLRNEIESCGMLVPYDQNVSFPVKKTPLENGFRPNLNIYQSLMPYLTIESICKTLGWTLDADDLKLTINDLERLNAKYLKSLRAEEYEVDGVGDLFDNFNCSSINLVNGLKKITIEYKDDYSKPYEIESNNCNNYDSNESMDINFSFDLQPDLHHHPGPSPSIILQALTMSNANDGINLERLETIGDSFLKYAITTYLYITYENVHEGKLSHLRSKQVANLNLYRLGRRKNLGECMIATKFEPHDNWLPPCYYVPKELEQALIEARIPPSQWNLRDLPNIKDLSSEQICELVRKKAEELGLSDDEDMEKILTPEEQNPESFTCFIPYNLVTQHSIPDKSIADCVEALIGAYLIECGPRGALLFMAWLGIRVLPMIRQVCDDTQIRVPGSIRPNSKEIIIYGEWKSPSSPLLRYSPNPMKQLSLMLDGYEEFENKLCYKFRDRSYLLQAMTHASYSPNRLNDCYQRLEFLGDAVLDYIISRYLYEDKRRHSPGALTDLRSALVNNTIFASLAVRHGFHKYFRHLSPGLNDVIDRFVRIQHENGHSISEEFYLLSEEECDDAVDVEVPKALGDVFESIAGAIYLDSEMSLDTVWRVYSKMMKPEIEQFSNSVPKSPIRELLELEPETAKFGKPEKLADGRRVRVTVEIFGKGTFRGIGRNYRIAKGTAAKCALRYLKTNGLVSKKH
ncbi:DICER1 family protein [Megaselia abdita]